VTASTAKKPDKRFRRAFDAIANQKVLVPYLESALVGRGSTSWPDEWTIKVDNKEHLFDGYFHPSGHAAMPALMLYYQFHPDTQPRLEFGRETPISVMTLQMGSAIHALVQSMLVHLDLVDPEEVEVSFVNEFRHCSGTLDARKLKVADGPLLEIKGWARLPQKPLPQHELQMQPYMDLGCEEPRDYGILLYVEKPYPHRFQEFIVRRDEQILEAIYRKWAAVREAIETSDPSRLLNCPGCEPNNKVHAACPARFVCRIGPPRLTRGAS
jgi:hypothetical protein